MQVNSVTIPCADLSVGATLVGEGKVTTIDISSHRHHIHVETDKDNRIRCYSNVASVAIKATPLESVITDLMALPEPCHNEVMVQRILTGFSIPSYTDPYANA